MELALTIGGENDQKQKEETGAVNGEVWGPTCTPVYCRGGLIGCSGMLEPEHRSSGLD